MVCLAPFFFLTLFSGATRFCTIWLTKSALSNRHYYSSKIIAVERLQQSCARASTLHGRLTDEPFISTSYVQSNLDEALRQFRQYTIFLNLTIRIDTDYIPDISVYPKRVIKYGETDPVHITEMPLTVVEIVSPSQSANLDEFPIYFQAGVKSCWLVMPISKAVNLYTAIDQVEIVNAGEVVDPVLNIHIPLNEIFA
jgi:Uma2 family endonuclease